MSPIKIANAPCSWGVLEFDLEGKAAGYAQVLDEMAASGYAGTELGDWGFMPTEPSVLRQELQNRNLSLLGAFVPAALLHPETYSESMASCLRVADLLAATGDSPFIVLADDNGKVDFRTRDAGRIQPDQGLNDSEWRIFADGANHFASTVKERTGLRTVFHHHCAGYVETPEEVSRLLELTDPSLLGLCFDTGHYTYGGGNALEGIKNHADRIWHVHYKDCHPGIASEARTSGWDYFTAVKHGVFCELGKGEVDFTAITQYLKNRNYADWIVVEQDVLPGMGTPLDSASRNRSYLKSLGL